LSSQLEACVNTIDAMQKTMASTKFDEPVGEKKSSGDYTPPAGATFA